MTTRNQDPLRFVKFNSDKFIRIPTRERKLEPIPYLSFITPERHAANDAQCCCSAQSRRLQYCDDFESRMHQHSYSLSYFVHCGSSSVASFCKRQIEALTVSNVSIVVIAAGIALIKLVPMPL